MATNSIVAFDIHGDLCDGVLEIPKKMKIMFHKLGYIYILLHGKLNAEINTGKLRIGDIEVIAEKQNNREVCIFYYVKATPRDHEEVEMSGIYAPPQISNLEYLRKYYPKKIKHLPVRYRQGRVPFSSVFNQDDTWGVSFFDKGGIVYNHVISDIPSPTYQDLFLGLDKGLKSDFKTWIQPKVGYDAFENISTVLDNLKEEFLA